MALEPSLQEQELVRAAMSRRFTPLGRGERTAEAVMGGAFLIACLVLVVAAPPAPAGFDLVSALMCALALGLAAKVHFAVGPGYTVPTQLAFIPLAFTAPPALLAPIVAAVLVAGQVTDVVAGRIPLSRLALTPANAWFALGPATVLAITGAPAAAEVSLLLVLAMIAAQVAVDLGSSIAREALHGTLELRELFGESWLFAVDAALTPVAFLAALTVGERPWTVLAVVPLIAILAVFARERDARMRSLAELNDAYRGTAIVLGDVVEADDGYTGQHCRDVVELALAVGARFRLPAERMRNLEFGALLHDVGKVAIPKAIINKPGTLDEAEWAIVRGHTIEGQRMLDRVGGFMREVGLIVRSHHERWDGEGYPDGLAGTNIPLEARIISACDTWNAMTTTRSYRGALPEHVAARELRECAGTQFDPDVVAALLDVLQPVDAEEPAGEPVALAA